MTKGLTRFGIAMEPELLRHLDEVASTRGCTRSELLRDLARAEVARVSSRKRVPAVAAVTLVYNHHVRELSERLTRIQHDLGDRVRSAMHVHLDHDNCMEVIVLRGPSDELRGAAERMLATRGVTHGGMEIVDESALAASRSHRQREDEGGREKGRGHGHAHRRGTKRGIRGSSALVGTSPARAKGRRSEVPAGTSRGKQKRNR